MRYLVGGSYRGGVCGTWHMAHIEVVGDRMIGTNS